MARKRSPEHDWICRRCECPCDPPGPEPKHIGGGQGMRACGKTASPVLRSEFEAEMDEWAAHAIAAIRWHREMRRDAGLD